MRERLFLNSESEGPLAIRDMRRFITAGDGLEHQFPGADFRSSLINGRSGFFRGTGELERGLSRERENETQADERVEARHLYAEKNVSHSTVRGKVDLSGGHGTSPP